MATVKLNQGKKKGGGTGLIIGVVVSAVVLVGIVGVLLAGFFANRSKQEAQPEEIEERRNIVMTRENAEEVIEMMEQEEAVPPGYYTVTMNNTWHFAAGDAASSDAYVENKVENTNDVFFDLFLTTDEENAIYKSPVIPRGAKLENIALDVPLEAGSYDGVVIYHLIDENQNTLSTLRVAVTVVIES